jgi:hypothetical protein
MTTFGMLDGAGRGRRPPAAHSEQRPAGAAPLRFLPHRSPYGRGSD